MDNFILDCNAQTKDDLLRLIQVAMSVNCPGKKISHYKIVRLKGGDSDSFDYHHESTEGQLTFILMWAGHAPTRAKNPPQALPIPMNAEGISEIIWQWLDQIESKDRGEYLDHDGSNGKGFKVFCDFWGHVGDNRYAVCAVQPIWAWYGK